MCVLEGRMVKRKAECSPCVVSHIEVPNLEGELSSIPTNSGPRSLVTGPTREETTEGVTSCHVSLPPATVAKERGDVADAF